MRKRKSPIVLVTMLVVVAVGVVGFNFAASRMAGPDAPPAAPQVENAEQVGQARPATDPKSISGAVKASMSNAKPASAGQDPEGRPGGPPSGPLILNPMANVKPEKPKPNATSTSAQWYNDQSAMGKKD